MTNLVVCSLGMMIVGAVGRLSTGTANRVEDTLGTVKVSFITAGENGPDALGHQKKIAIIAGNGKIHGRPGQVAKIEQ